MKFCVLVLLACCWLGARGAEPLPQPNDPAPAEKDNTLDSSQLLSPPSAPAEFSVRAKKPPPPPKNAKSPPPPPKNSDANVQGDGGGVSTTTIIIAVCAGVGGLIAVVVVTVIWCSCRKKKTPPPAKNASLKGGDVEENGNGMRASDVYKNEVPPPPGFPAQTMSAHAPAHPQYAAQAAPPPQYAARVMPPPPQYAAQAVPMAGPMAAPASSSAPMAMSAGGPLGAGAASGAAVMAASHHSTSSKMSGRSMPRSSAHQQQMPPRQLSHDNLVAAGVVEVDDTDYNDALLTWIGGQLSKEKELNSNASKKASRGTRPAVPSPSRSHFEDVSSYAIAFDALRMGRLIGTGSFGKVYLANWNETPVAVKILVDESSALDSKINNADRLRNMAKPLLDKLNEEAGMMASMRHPNIVQFMGIVMMPPCVITEFAERGSLTDVLRAGRKGVPGAAEALSWRLRLGMAAEAATGMLYLHARSQPIIHRDLKSANILVETNWRVKISDFNLSKLFIESTQSSSLAAMNPRWLANECIAGEPASTASDVFSFAVVMWELLTWELPWAKENPWSVANNVGHGARLPVPQRWELPGHDTAAFAGLDSYIALMKRCWAHNPYDRPGFQEIVQELRALEAEMKKISPSPSLASLPPMSAVSSGGPPAAGGPGSVATHPQSLHGTIPASESNYYFPGPGAGGANDDDEEYNDVTASISSTQVMASIDHLGTLPKWRSGGGWDTMPKQ